MTPKPQSSRVLMLALALWCLTLGIVLGARILGPSDLGQNLDQSKTIAFTLDMVHNGEWVLPKDSLGRLSRKPPMVNWVGAPFVAIGWHSELALKIPAVLSGVGIAILVCFVGRFFYRRLDQDGNDDADRWIAANAPAMGVLASAAWLASPSAIKHIYFMRPDILFAALLCGAWFASVVLLSSPDRKRPLLALLVWFLGACAILTKGPMAVLVPMYLLVHILIIVPRGQRRSALSKTGWWWGIPVMVLIPGLWLWGAYQANPEHVRTVLFGQELGGRVGNNGIAGILNATMHNPGYFFERFLPWSLPAAMGIIFKPSAKIRTHPLAPASLWILLVLAITTLSSLSAGSYIMPAYPPAALLAVYVIFRLVAKARATRIKPAVAVIVGLVIVLSSMIAGREATRSRGARTGTGEHLKDFAHTAARTVGTDAVVFSQMGDLPIASLMGRFQADEIELSEAHGWVIQPTQIDPNREVVLTSGALVTHDLMTGVPIDATITVSLYRVDGASQP